MPKRVTLASVVYELGIAFGTAVMVGAYFVIELPDLEGQSARYAVLAVVPIVLAGFHPRVFEPVVNFALAQAGPRAAAHRCCRSAACSSCASPTSICWALIGLGVFAFASGLHPLDASDLPYVAASYPVAFCVAVLTFVVPSGIGTRDAALATAMAAVLAGAVATAIAVAFRIFQTAIELAYVAAVSALEKRR